MTSLVGGTRIAKTDVRLEAYGTVDELNSAIGVLWSELQNPQDKTFVTVIQHKLFVLGAQLASEDDLDPSMRLPGISAQDVQEIEAEMDRIDAALPPLRFFVLPAGCRAASAAHLARSICRRAERRILSLAAEYPVEKQAQVYVNRLSDYLFLLSRKANNEAGVEEIKWEK